MRTKVVCLVFLMVFAEQTFCHHVGAAQYHPGSTIEIEGKVTHVFWQNPHVHFLVDVKDASGNVQEWDVESNSVSILRRMGITRNVVGPGSLVKIAGWPSRQSLPQVFATNMLLGDGKEVLLSPGSSPRWSPEVLGTRSIWTSTCRVAPRAGVVCWRQTPTVWSLSATLSEQPDGIYQ